jgi:CO dehydrogenase maturation factor
MFVRFSCRLALNYENTESKSVGVYRQYKTYAASYGLNIKALGNKVEGADDIAFLRMHCKDDLLGCFSMSPWVRRCDRGGQPDIAVLEPDNCQVIQIVLNAAMRASRDWQKYWHWGIHFHRKNAFA